ncbi:MAG: TerB family tellurite resistance protein, partial [Steroidobacteraceae bacterium]
MKWGGKLIGGTLGMAALGPIGAAIGLFIGHQFDAGGGASNLLGGTVFGPGADPHEVNRLFFPTTFRVMGYIAKADGRVSEQEIASARAVMHALHLQDSQIQKAIAYFGEGKRPDFDLQASLRRLRRAAAPFPELGHFFVEIQLQAALAGNGLPPPLRERITWIATRLGVGPIDVARLESMLRFRMGAGAGRPPGGGAGAANGAYISDEQRMAQAY